MSITVMVHFPIPFDQLGAADPNADWMVELGVLAREYGLTNQRYSSAMANSMTSSSSNRKTLTSASRTRLLTRSRSGKAKLGSAAI